MLEILTAEGTQPSVREAEEHATALRYPQHGQRTPRLLQADLAVPAIVLSGGTRDSVRELDAFRIAVPARDPDHRNGASRAEDPLDQAADAEGFVVGVRGDHEETGSRRREGAGQPL